MVKEELRANSFGIGKPCLSTRPAPTPYSKRRVNEVAP